MKLEQTQELKGIARKKLRTAYPGGEKLSRWISFGVGTTPEQDVYRLAVRIRTPVDNPRVTRQLTKLLRQLVPARDLDLQYTGPVYVPLPADRPRLCGLPSATAPPLLVIGSSIGHFNVSGGTLGFFATSIGDGTKGIVSANHVIAYTDQGCVDDEVLHPSYVLGGTIGSNTVAKLVRFVALSGAGEKYVDCAFAKLVTANFDASDLGGGRKLQRTIANVQESYNVSKIGSGRIETGGYVLSFDYDCFEVFAYDGGLVDVPFEDQIEVESVSASYPFSRPGDSGSLVFNDNLRAVGLLFAQTDGGGKYQNGLSYVNPMARVLKDLQVDLLT